MERADSAVCSRDGKHRVRPMSRPLDLSSAIAKYRWGKHHAEVLAGDVEGWAKDKAHPPVTFRREHKPEERRVIWWINEVRPLRPEWPMMFGDAVTNLNSSLDHAAVAMVRAGGSPNSKLNQVYFPVCHDDRTHYLNACAHQRLPGVSKRRKLILSPIQPYKRRVAGGMLHPLVFLKELARTDKHNELLLTLVRPVGWQYTGQGVLFDTEDPISPGEPFEPGTKAASLRYRGPVRRDLNMRVEFDATMSITTVHGLPVADVLSWLEDMVAIVLGELGVPDAILD